MPDHVAGELAAGALAFLDVLDEAQRNEALIAFGNPARLDWHYFPRGDFDRGRPGLALTDMRPDQREHAWAMLRTALSEEGWGKVCMIPELDAILRRITGGAEYGPLEYGFLVFGDPAGGEPWGFRAEGHHLSLTFTVAPGQPVAVTPSFVGAHPAKVPPSHAHEGLRVLGEEQDRAFALIQGLDVAQRAVAVIAHTSMGDILTGPGREGGLHNPTGLPFPRLTEAQRESVMDLMACFMRNLRPELADRALADVRQAGTEHIHFAWAGALRPGAPHYFRIHGPSALIEYDNTQNGANHVHSVWHDPNRDFGGDLLRRHHERDHSTR